MTDVHSVNLSRRYEERLFSAKALGASGRVVPAVVITGFLGAGKTTLVQHVLRTGHDLRLGVLVNEVGAVDLDSQLVNAKQSNAAVGIKAAELAGGCACCSIHGELEQALADLVSSPSYASLDALIVETSGVADAEPLAQSLAKRGFRLDAVVAVVDAEAGLATLEQQIAVAQVRAADMVVLNKCDLADLGAIADVEDRLHALAPGIRLLRARFGQVPLEAVLDVDVDVQADATCSSSGRHEGDSSSIDGAGQQSATASSSAAGEVAFLSHEGFLGQQSQRQKRAVAGARRNRTADPPAGQQKAGNSDTMHHHHHSALHSGFQSVSVVQEVPLCMACFQRFVLEHLMHAKGLFRAKGLLWFQQRRSARYTFHLSGRQRIQCMQEGTWEGPPRTQFVLIGQHVETLQQLQQQLLACMAETCACRDHSSSMDATTSQAEAQAAGAVRCLAAAEFAKLVAQHPRLQLKTKSSAAAGSCQDAATANGNVTGNAHLADGVVEFSVEGSPLHGVVAEEVNAALVCKVNTCGLFLCCVSSPVMLSASTGLQMVESNVASLQYCWRPSDTAEDAAAAWEQLSAAAASVLRKAFQHVHNCKCDVAGAAMAQLQG